MPEPLQTGELHKRVRELEARIRSIPIPEGSLARLRSRLDEAGTYRPKRAWPVARLVLAACLAALIVLAVLWLDQPRDITGFMGFSVPERSADFHWTSRSPSVVEVTRGSAVLEDASLEARLSVAQGTCFERARQGLRLIHGRLGLVVKPRKQQGRPVRILVSHGIIEVLGTRFSVLQEQQRGEVTLHEGRIRFRDQSGRAVTLVPGQTLRWPLDKLDEAEPAPAPPEEAPSAGASKPPPARPRVALQQHMPAAPVPEPQPTFDPEAFARELDELRIQRRFQLLIDRIRQELPRLEDPHLAESLSYEIGLVLTYRIQDRHRACQHWRHHLAQFPGGRDLESIQDAKTQLGCPEI